MWLNVNKWVYFPLNILTVQTQGTNWPWVEIQCFHCHFPQCSNPGYQAGIQGINSICISISAGSRGTVRTIAVLFFLITVVIVCLRQGLGLLYSRGERFWDSIPLDPSWQSLFVRKLLQSYRVLDSVDQKWKSEFVWVLQPFIYN